MQKIIKEVELGRIVGHFTTLPYKNLQISPLGLVPKKERVEYRLIHHLSYPLGSSINDGISDINKTVQYETLDIAIFYINKLASGILLAKSDLESAFRIIPIHPQDYELLGMEIAGKFYYDRCLPMGCAISCQFEKLRSALHWIMENQFFAGYMVHVLDDFLFMGSSKSTHCHNVLHNFF